MKRKAQLATAGAAQVDGLPGVTKWRWGGYRVARRRWLWMLISGCCRRERVDAVASALLGDVERPVGVAQQSVGRRRVGGHHGHPEARGNRRNACELGVSDLDAQLLGHEQAGRPGGGGEQKQELLAPEARGDAAFAL